MMILNDKLKSGITLALLLLVAAGAYQAGKSSAQKELTRARTELAELKTQNAKDNVAAAAAYAQALAKANAAAAEQQNKTANVSKQLAIANTATKDKAKKIKELINETQTNDHCPVLDANGVRIYNEALGY